MFTQFFVIFYNDINEMNDCIKTLNSALKGYTRRITNPSDSGITLIETNKIRIKLVPASQEQKLLMHATRTNHTFHWNELNTADFCEMLAAFHGLDGKPPIKSPEIDDVQDIMIRATLNSNITKEDILKTNEADGLIGVFNLGLKCMLAYLNQ